MEEIGIYINQIVTKVIGILPQIAGAIAVVIIGFWVAKKITKIAKNALERSNFNPEISTFLSSLTSIGLKILVLISAAGIVGIETTSIVAVLAAAGFAIGLALQGSLSNFSAGILVLLFKPYKVGDWISVEDYFGKVEEIQIFNTIIATPGQKTLYIPNGQVVENVLTNYSTKGHLRLELNVTMPYEENFPKVKQIILNVLKDIPEVMKTPAPEVGIETYDSHSIVLGVRPYIAPDDYWKATYAVYEAIKSAFYEHKIKVAYSEGVELGSIGG